MKPPKLLPWLARKAGIPNDLALKLWRRAAAEAEGRIGNADSSEYFAAAIERFLDLVEGESSVRNLDGDGDLGWVWRYQKRMALHGLVASQAVCRWAGNLAKDLSQARFSA